MPKYRILIIPVLHGRLTADGKLTEPDIDGIFERWLDRHPQFRGPERDYQVIKAKVLSAEGIDVDKNFMWVTAEFSPDLAAYDPTDDADLYEEFLAERRNSPLPKPHKMWIEECDAARGIEDEFGTDRALRYLVEEKFINFLAAAEHYLEFRAEVPAFVAEIKTIFEPWQLRKCLNTHGKPNRLIPATTRQRTGTTPRTSRWSGRPTFAVRP